MATSSSSSSSQLDDLMQRILNNEGFSTNCSSSIVQDATQARATGWRLIDYNRTEHLSDVVWASPSAVTPVMIRDRLVHFKRDDQLRLPGSRISGNKARKFWALNILQDFPSAIVSYGGPQSNAMLALAAMVHFRNEEAGALESNHPQHTRFLYYTKTLSRFLRNQPSGNLFRALSLGMELKELANYEYNDLFGGDWGGMLDAPPNLPPPIHGHSLWVPQGGACAVALPGARRLAQEILEYWHENGDNRRLSVVLPGGTCSTAAYLHHALRDLQSSSVTDPLDVQVVVIPCVGDDGYARRQMMSLSANLGASVDDIPAILPPKPNEGYFGQVNMNDAYLAFGKPDPVVLETFLEFRDEYDMLLDLLYGAPAWTILLRHWRTIQDAAALSILSGREIMYVHSGGLEGINTQLLRYKYVGLVDADETQLPGKTKKLPKHKEEV